MSSSSKKTIACFGATGGCVGTALACALKEGHFCTALARTPSKLLEYLRTQHDISLETIEKHLTIYEGDIKDSVAVAKCLVSPTSPTRLVDVILSGVGAYPYFQWSIRQPFPLTDPTICVDALRTIYKALSNLLSPGEIRDSRISRINADEKKPLLVVITTSGCGRNRGVPLPVYLPYHYFLSSPLADKKNMEKLILGDENTLKLDFVIMRPFVLTEGAAKEDKDISVGWEWGVERVDEGSAAEPGPVLGYTISKRTVGTWTFNHVIVQGGWEGKCVYLK